MIFCCVNGKYFASFLIRKLLAKFIRRTSVARSLIDLTQNDDKFAFNRPQKLMSLTMFSPRSSRMHRMLSDSFGVSSQLFTGCSEDELFMTGGRLRYFDSEFVNL